MTVAFEADFDRGIRKVDLLCGARNEKGSSGNGEGGASGLRIRRIRISPISCISEKAPQISKGDVRIPQFSEKSSQISEKHVSIPHISGTDVATPKTVGKEPTPHFSVGPSCSPELGKTFPKELGYISGGQLSKRRPPEHRESHSKGISHINSSQLCERRRSKLTETHSKELRQGHIWTQRIISRGIPHGSVHQDSSPSDRRHLARLHRWPRHPRSRHIQHQKNEGVGPVSQGVRWLVGHCFLDVICKTWIRGIIQHPPNA